MHGANQSNGIQERKGGRQSKRSVRTDTKTGTRNDWIYAKAQSHQLKSGGGGNLKEERHYSVIEMGGRETQEFGGNWRRRFTSTRHEQQGRESQKFRRSGRDRRRWSRIREVDELIKHQQGGSRKNIPGLAMEKEWE
ncbi:similar to An14g06840 [Aspergillus luchuensis]|uniref:Similar to An14g06840 n=1 Tax=Aspergillus kawachii TaxID=1069201 RepID=A0A146F4K1_ASPKA|nr:similar to An14g06840 [Aspergillus luchuensis]